MDAKVTAVEMAVGIEMAYDGIQRTVTKSPVIDRMLTELLAARDYILAAESQIAERDAQNASVELSLRKEWWLNHGCHISVLYGDDGEMQCNAACCMKDFKRRSIEELSAHVVRRRLAAATADMTLLEEARAQIAARDTRIHEANVRASELFDQLGIAQNAAATQIGELERQIEEMRKVISPYFHAVRP